MSTETGLRERKKRQTRQLLADTARRLFSERGFEQVSVAEIARAADVSAATVFNYFPTKEDLVFSGRIKLDPSRNDFPVTMHDPCNMVRLMGIVEPQRRIVRHICPQFREMTPHGVHNYCCGGGSGFAIMTPYNFQSWRNLISGRKKFEQVLNAFSDDLSPETHKYLCAPCSNCKGQLRDMLFAYDAWEKCGILYGGLVELIVNAMTDVEPGFVEWEWH